MASYLQIENISKSYGPKILFEKIGFNINEVFPVPLGAMREILSPSFILNPIFSNSIFGP